MNILIVDDERSLRHVMRKYLSPLPDVELFEAASKDEAIDLLARQPIDIAFVDIRLSPDATNRDGQAIIKHIREHLQAIPVVVSSLGEIEEIKIAMKNGAYDYLLKETLSPEVLAPIVAHLGLGVNNRELKQQIRLLRDRDAQDMKARFIGISAAAERTRSLIRRYAFTDRPVLVAGPTGTGKEVTASLLHYFSEHPDEPMLSINCGALPASLIESQLFGHRKGSFTGANENREGFFQAVGKGTLFLDEIAELPLELQPALLRVLENRTFMPLGSNTEFAFMGRIVAATHADLAERVAQGTFRADLYFRLNVLKIELPPLSLRIEDIPLFVARFLHMQQRKMAFSSGAMSCLMEADWPGNIRQLRNVVDMLAILYDEPLITEEMVQEVLGIKSPKTDVAVVNALIKQLVEIDLNGADKLKFVENALIAHALESSQGNKSAAAKLLGVHRKVIQRRVEGENGEDRGGKDDLADAGLSQNMG